MTEIRYNNKTYGAISNNSRDIVYNDTTVKNEIDLLKSKLITNNLLINSNFASPINQRQFTELTVSSVNYEYTIDRWVISKYEGAASTTLKLGNRCVVLSGDKTGDGVATFGQFIEHLIGGTYTLSTKINGKIYSHTFVYTEEEDFQTTMVWENDFIGIGANHNGTKRRGTHMFVWIAIQSKDLPSANIEWVKLEEGRFATPYSYSLYQGFTDFEACKLYFKTAPIYGHVCYVDTNTIIAYHHINDWSCSMAHSPEPNVFVVNILKNNIWQGGLDQWTIENIEKLDDNFRITYKKESHGITQSDRIGVFAHFALDAEL